MVNGTQALKIENEINKPTAETKKKTPDDGELFAYILTTQDVQKNPEPEESLEEETSQKIADQKETVKASPTSDSQAKKESTAEKQETTAKVINSTEDPPEQAQAQAQEQVSQQMLEQLIDGANLQPSKTQQSGDKVSSAKPTNQGQQGVKFITNIMDQPIIFETGMAQYFIRLLTSRFEEMKNLKETKPEKAEVKMAQEPVFLNTSRTELKTSSMPLQKIQIQPADQTAQENLNRIVQIIRSNIGRRQSQMTVQLDPPQLGKLRLDIRLNDNILQLNIMTETTEARQIIIDRMETLRANLETSGIQISRFEVVVKSNDPQQSQNWQRQDGRNFNQNGGFNQQGQRDQSRHGRQDEAMGPDEQAKLLNLVA